MRTLIIILMALIIILAGFYAYSIFAQPKSDFTGGTLVWRYNYGNIY